MEFRNEKLEHKKRVDNVLSQIKSTIKSKEIINKLEDIITLSIMLDYNLSGTTLGNVKKQKIHWNDLEYSIYFDKYNRPMCSISFVYEKDNFKKAIISATEYFENKHKLQDDFLTQKYSTYNNEDKVRVNVFDNDGIIEVLDILKNNL